jgi:hypothetical protein
MTNPYKLIVFIKVTKIGCFFRKVTRLKRRDRWGPVERWRERERESESDRKRLLMHVQDNETRTLNVD